MNVIKSVRKRFGEAHTSIYQTPNTFTMRPRKNKYIRTNFWIEISGKPLPKRPTPDWPVPDWPVE
jgi:hypothetical protein